MKQIVVLFAGGGIVDTAIADMGLETTYAVECDREVAKVYKQNFPSTQLIESRVEEVDYSIMANEETLLLHASTSCKSFSIANNTNALRGVSPQDIAAIKGVVDAIRTLKPLYFTLEQVRGYSDSICFDILLQCLRENNYSYSFDVLNACHYGVPQHRERLILTAVRSRRPVGLPPKKRPKFWVDILDMNEFIPTTPTLTQREAMREKLKLFPSCEYWLLQRRGYRKELIIRQEMEVSPTITCSIFSDGKGANRQDFYDIYNSVKDEWHKLSIRNMAQLQTIPDWYQLPEETRIAGTIIGNGVPTKLYEAILEQLIWHSKS